jgi:hypothetical protein
MIASPFETWNVNRIDAQAWLIGSLGVIAACHRESQIDDLLP